MPNHIDKAIDLASYAPYPPIAVPASLYGMGRDVQKYVFNQTDENGNPVSLPTLGADALGVLASLYGGKAGMNAGKFAAKSLEKPVQANGFSAVAKEITLKNSKIGSIENKALEKSLNMLHNGEVPLNSKDFIRNWKNKLMQIISPEEAEGQIIRIQLGDKELSKEASIAMQQVLDPEMINKYADASIPGALETAKLLNEKYVKEAPYNAAKELSKYIAASTGKSIIGETKEPLNAYMNK
jgi:hypothetical protein